MKKIYMKARAKINLNLEITGRRKDKYHNIESVFQKINLYDELYIEKFDSDNIQLETNIEELNNEDNIIYKTYIKLQEKYHEISGVYVKLKKRIPMQSGLGGGSTDCASFILGMNKLFNLKMTEKEIINIGKTIGADVVPCLYDKAVKAEGIGDVITKINTNFKYYIVIVKPEIFNNTGEMYKKIDEKNLPIQKKNTNKIINALEKNDIELLSCNLYNVFEEVVGEGILKIKNELIKQGAENSLMTGSGSCVYGLFKNKQIAEKAFNNLKKNYQTYICTSYNSFKENQF